MEKNKKQQLKENAASGASSFAGTAAGVVVGSFAMPNEAAAQEVQENETTTTEAEDTTATDTQQSTAQEQSVEAQTPEPKPTAVSASSNTATTQQNQQSQPATQQETEVEVIDYQTVENPDGTQSDIAVVSVNGETVLLADVDQDGTADVLAADFNHNNQLEENEIVEITDNPIQMQPLADAVGSNPAQPNANANLVADNSGEMPDYVNNANVGDYMA